MIFLSIKFYISTFFYYYEIFFIYIKLIYKLRNINCLDKRKNGLFISKLNKLSTFLHKELNYLHLPNPFPHKWSSGPSKHFRPAVLLQLSFTRSHLSYASFVAETPKNKKNAVKYIKWFYLFNVYHCIALSKSKLGKLLITWFALAISARSCDAMYISRWRWICIVELLSTITVVAIIKWRVLKHVQISLRTNALSNPAIQFMIFKWNMK